MAITFFDLETPNRMNNSICSIGLIRTDDFGNEEYRKSYLVNPECDFDSINTSIHGITLKDVLASSTFIELWDSELSNIIDGSIVVAHNATFDLSVLDKALSRYGRTLEPISYLCTLQAARRMLPKLNNYKLPTVCDALGVYLEMHHQALSDAVACMGVYLELTAMGADFSFINRYEHIERAVCTPKEDAKLLCRSLTDLYGVIIGVAIDQAIYPEELVAFEDWIDEQGDSPSESISAVILLLKEVLADGVMTQCEKNQLLNLLSPFVNESCCAKTTTAMQELIGIVKGIGADKHVSNVEAEALRNWIANNSSMLDDPLIADVFAAIDAALADNVITIEEESLILERFNALIDPIEQSSTINLNGKKVCLSGDFEFGSKNDVASRIESLGGSVVSNVSRKCDYVIVGGKGSERYAFGNYGSKVKKAMGLQAEGFPILIVTETDLDI